MAQLHVENLTSPDELENASNFFHSIWADGPEVVPFDLAIAIVHAGGYCSGLYQGTALVGASLGLRGLHHGMNVLHSHVTASTVPSGGFLLKHHQRAWALEQGLSHITWTFDPLVRRNAFFNLTKLGAVAVEYLPNFYGTMTDAINAGDESDRVLALWDLNHPQATPSDALRHCAVSIENELPMTHGVQDGIENLIYLPTDIERLRQMQDANVTTWRQTVRAALLPTLNTGWQLTGMVGKLAYILSPPRAKDI